MSLVVKTHNTLYVLLKLLLSFYLFFPPSFLAIYIYIYIYINLIGTNELGDLNYRYFHKDHQRILVEL